MLPLTICSSHSPDMLGGSWNSYAPSGMLDEKTISPEDIIMLILHPYKGAQKRRVFVSTSRYTWGLSIGE